jgi:hypothetical protein
MLVAVLGGLEGWGGVGLGGWVAVACGGGGGLEAEAVYLLLEGYGGGA